MSKHSANQGSNRPRRVRSLFSFRHQTAAGRVVSMTAAFAMATLLVVGTGAAYADDTAPPSDPAATAPADGSSPSTDTSTPTDTTAPSDTSTSADSSTAGDSASAPASEPAAPTPPRAKHSKTGTATSPLSAPTLLKLASPALLAGTTVDVPCDFQSPDWAIVAGFEIDGNLCLTGDPTNGTEDWDSLTYADPEHGAEVLDGLGDTSGFTEGSSEVTDPLGWVGGHVPNDKNDIESAWGYSKAVSGHVYAYFGFTSSSQAGGTQEVNMEYNQADPQPNDANDLQVPDRTVGDLLFHFGMNGSAALSFDSVLVWTLQSDDSWIPPSKDPDSCTAVSGYTPAAGWCPVTGIPASAFHSAVSDDGQFAEGSIDISALPIFADTCSGQFGTMQMRTVTGNSWSSTLKDYVGPLAVNTPSNCGSLVITKTDADTSDPAVRVGGAVFAITDDPRPGETGTLCVYDGPAGTLPPKPAGCDSYYADGTADGTVTIAEVESGTYEVTELVPPPGYLLNGDPNDTVSGVVVGTIDSDHPVGHADFANRKLWEPLTVSKTAHGTNTVTYHWTINKQISETGLADSWLDAKTPGAPLTKTVGAGGDTSLYYRVIVDHGDPATTGSNYAVAGTITVHNTNSGTMAATIKESLPGCTLDVGGDSLSDADGASVSVAHGDIPFAYTCDLGNTAPASTLKNKATVTWDMTDYPQATEALLADTDPTHYTADTGDVTFQPFEETESIDQSVTVTDDNGTPANTSDDSVLGTVAWADAPWTSDVYSNDPAPAPGTCSAVITNTAKIFGDGEDALGSSSESGKVCQDNAADLSVTATVHESLVRTFPWTLDKNTTTPSVVVSGGKAVANYSVTVTAGAPVDSAWAMSGTVTVSNPNDFESVHMTNLTVDFTGTDDETCTVHESVTPIIALSDSAGFTFDCAFPSRPLSLVGAIVATASWDGAAAGTTHNSASEPPGPATNVADAGWVKTLVNDTVDVWDDNATPGDTSDDKLLDTLAWADVYAMTEPDHQVVLTYSSDITTGLPAAGACNVHTNTAKVLSGESVLDSDTADVQVCTPAIVVAPPIVSPPHPSVLPDTGGPDQWLLAAGLALLLGGGALVMGDRRRRHRS